MLLWEAVHVMKEVSCPQLVNMPEIDLVDN